MTWEYESRALLWTLLNYVKYRQGGDPSYTKSGMEEGEEGKQRKKNSLAYEWDFPPGTVNRWQPSRPPTLTKKRPQRDQLRRHCGQAMLGMALGASGTFVALAREVGMKTDRLRELMGDKQKVPTVSEYRQIMAMIGPRGRTNDIVGKTREDPAFPLLVMAELFSTELFQEASNKNIARLLGVSGPYIGSLKRKNSIPSGPVTSRMLTLLAVMASHEDGPDLWEDTDNSSWDNLLKQLEEYGDLASIQRTGPLSTRKKKPPQRELALDKAPAAPKASPKYFLQLQVDNGEDGATTRLTAGPFRTEATAQKVLDVLYATAVAVAELEGDTTSRT
jgi:hypothetical protein